MGNGRRLRASGHPGGHADLWQVACVLHNIYVKHVSLPNNDKLLTLAKQAWYSFGALLLRKINPAVIAQRDKKDRWQCFIDKRFCLYFRRIYFLPLYWYPRELRQRDTIFHVFVRMRYYYGWRGPPSLHLGIWLNAMSPAQGWQAPKKCKLQN